MKNHLKVLIWGAGMSCRQRIKHLPEQWEILSIIDSDLNKQGLYWENTNIKIVAPDRINDYEYDFIIIISRFWNEIYASLINMGISVTKIIVYRFNEMFNSALTLEEYQNHLISLADKKKKQLNSKYRFEDRKKNHNSLFYVLAGYKKDLWEDVFERMRIFLPKDVDVCLLSSGLYSDELSRIAAENDWSYLSTDVNDVSIIQNIAIHLFPEADYIYKMDEDIYVTKDCCEIMKETYMKLEEENNFRIGMIGPMIPLHTNGWLFLQSMQLSEEYEKRFGKLCRGGRWTNYNYSTDAEIPQFLWSQGNIDDLNKSVRNVKPEYYITPVKYAICFVLFSRKLYERMGGFFVYKETYSTGMNGDEGQINSFCMQHCLCNVVALNTICGHFCYPAQEKEMLRFKNENPEYFEIRMT